MNDEEKKAIANLKTEYEKLIKEDNILFPLYKSDAKRLIDIIEKQSKEIEESKQKEKEAYNFGYRNGCNDTSKFNDKTFIRIDKVNAKIEEYEKNKKILEERKNGVFYSVEEIDKVDRNIKFYDVMINEMQSLLEKE